MAAGALTVTRHYAIVSGSPTFEAWTTYQRNRRRSFGLERAADDGPERHAELAHRPPGRRRRRADRQRVHASASDALDQQPLHHRRIAPRLRAHRSLVLDRRRQGRVLRGADVVGRVVRGLRTNRRGHGDHGRPAADVDNVDVERHRWPAHAVRRRAWRASRKAPERCARTYWTAFAGGRPIASLVTYNTWFAYGTEIDETSMRTEMDHAAALGVELFVIDAGWYPGTGAAGPFDFDAGLGGWTADPARFPNGLGPLREYAHSLGMQFGLWVEPERVNLSLVGAPGVEEAWLATEGGQVRIGSCRPDLSRQCRRAPVADGPPDDADRRRAARLPEVGQQHVRELRSRGTRTRARRRQLRAYRRALRHVLASCARAIRTC